MESALRRLGRGQSHLDSKQPPFPGEARAVATEAPSLGEDPVAGNEDGDGVCPHRLAHSLAALGLPTLRAISL